MTTVPRRHLDRDLARLRARLLALGDTVQRAVEDGLRAFHQRDLELAERIRDGDRTIDEAEVGLEEECLKVLALHQPVAGDLRLVVAYLKVNNDLERAGDLARNVAERTLELLPAPPLPPPEELAQLGRCAAGMLEQSIAAVLDSDTAAARRVIEDDETADALHRAMYGQIADLLRRQPERTDAILKILSVSRYLERIADLATNLAEDVVFMVEGSIVRHQG